MREMNCRNVRREVEEATPGDLLSSPVKDHLMNCVACETFSSEQCRLQQLVSCLGAVEAPGDFDFRLRARLAGEKPGSARPFSALSLGSLSFGLPSAAVAAMLLLVVSALVFVSFRSQLPNSSLAGKPTTEQTSKAVASGPGKEAVKSAAPAATTNAGGNQQKVALAGDKFSKASDSAPAKRHSPRIEVASLRGRNNVIAKDLSSTRAPVLTGDSQMVGTYPTSAFPIDASYQSLKVSVDNGRGASRTISLPTVSFGSNQSLSQNGSLLMASSRVAW
jgi:hypothetical protein